MPAPLVTVVVPSLNQGGYLSAALQSIAAQAVETEILVLDGGSTDGSLAVIEAWASRLAGWRSAPDGGQASAINEGILRGSAPYVCWLNADDVLLPGALGLLVAALERNPSAPVAYGQAFNIDASGRTLGRYWTMPFSRRRLAWRCFICQPATLIRRSAWAAVGGLDESLLMALDYELWWRLSERFGDFSYVEAPVACNRVHAGTKTKTRRREHHLEAIEVVRRHHGRVPWKWYLSWPWSVWYKAWR